jgi:hypothetical protein
MIPPTLIAAGVAGVAFLGLIGSTTYYKNDRDTIQAEFTGYKATVKAQGEKAEAEKQLQELKNANKIAAAVVDRDAAIKQLRVDVAQARSRIRTLPSNPTAPSGSRQVCFGSEAYNAAFQQFGTSLSGFLQDATGLAYEGDSAILDAKTLIQSWPAGQVAK